eukprot:Protomagalhaensia_sp_Gyna_25__2408@NODE_2339_length_1139_cov_97_494545_g1940_i0_p2_GENE_NODE_2339_length_1139_cov_97_494545_g1940_i0NODE_2339_length_1139_cov_97_494545_g1940_i0_p2_ORF_typecomplete_len102_score2_91NPFF/PF15085_6/0_069_NODE_2339_length_1139_cov_97_494545_g1940_i077382
MKHSYKQRSASSMYSVNKEQNLLETSLKTIPEIHVRSSSEYSQPSRNGRVEWKECLTSSLNSSKIEIPSDIYTQGKDRENLANFKRGTVVMCILRHSNLMP